MCPVPACLHPSVLFYEQFNTIGPLICFLTATHMYRYIHYCLVSTDYLLTTVYYLQTIHTDYRLLNTNYWLGPKQSKLEKNNFCFGRPVWVSVSTPSTEDYPIDFHYKVRLDHISRSRPRKSQNTNDEFV